MRIVALGLLALVVPGAHAQNQSGDYLKSRVSNIKDYLTGVKTETENELAKDTNEFNDAKKREVKIQAEAQASIEENNTEKKTEDTAIKTAMASIAKLQASIDSDNSHISDLDENLEEKTQEFQARRSQLTENIFADRSTIKTLSAAAENLTCKTLAEMACADKSDADKPACIEEQQKETEVFVDGDDAADIVARAKAGSPHPDFIQVSGDQNERDLQDLKALSMIPAFVNSKVFTLLSTGGVAAYRSNIGPICGIMNQLRSDSIRRTQIDTLDIDTITAAHNKFTETTSEDRTATSARRDTNEEKKAEEMEELARAKKALAACHKDLKNSHAQNDDSLQLLRDLTGEFNHRKQTRKASIGALGMAIQAFSGGGFEGFLQTKAKTTGGIFETLMVKIKEEIKSMKEVSGMHRKSIEDCRDQMSMMHSKWTAANTAEQTAAADKARAEGQKALAQKQKENAGARKDKAVQLQKDINADFETSQAEMVNQIKQLKSGLGQFKKAIDAMQKSSTVEMKNANAGGGGSSAGGGAAMKRVITLLETERDNSAQLLKEQQAHFDDAREDFANQADTAKEAEENATNEEQAAADDEATAQDAVDAATNRENGFKEERESLEAETSSFSTLGEEGAKVDALKWVEVSGGSFANDEDALCSTTNRKAVIAENSAAIEGLQQAHEHFASSDTGLTTSDVSYNDNKIDKLDKMVVKLSEMDSAIALDKASSDAFFEGRKENASSDDKTAAIKKIEVRLIGELEKVLKGASYFGGDIPAGAPYEKITGDDDLKRGRKLVNLRDLLKAYQDKNAYNQKGGDDGDIPQKDGNIDWYGAAPNWLDGKVRTMK